MVIIKGFEMPKSCMDCPFRGFDRAGGRGNICTINDSITLHAVLDGIDVKFVRMGDCPLVPVPPHGRLIDAGELTRHEFTGLQADKKISYQMGWNDALMVVAENAPTIIPAEEAEE